jgi:demethylmenaquinone methyltransferase/2-methoxy-6-polyprenyl-1,4-benzoquinol methylase
MNRGLALAGIRMFRPKGDMNVLDVGCGTGTHLELYQRFGCNLYGIDLSPSMLEKARVRLGESAQLELGDATSMPYESRKFDLIITKLTLHEMFPQTRSGVLTEMKRVLKDDGYILLIDFHPGPYQFLKGWISSVTIFSVELAAGRQHFKNYRQFISTKGLSTLVKMNGLEVKKQKILAGGTLAAYLTTHRKI